MKITAVGIVVAKENSKRFPGKNIYPYKNEPLFWHSVKPLLSSEFIDEIYVATNSNEIIEYCNQKNIKTIWRGPNIIDDEEPLLSVLRYSYQSLNKEYEYVATIMANCPHHTADEVNQALLKISQGNFNEIRGFDNHGIETGLLIFKSEVIKNCFQISSHIGMIESKGYEIHYVEDLSKL